MMTGAPKVTMDARSRAVRLRSATLFSPEKFDNAPSNNAPGRTLRQIFRRQKIKLNWRILTRVDHSFRRITGDNGDVQQRKKQRVFPGSAIERQDCVAGAKGVSKDFPHGSALGTDP